MPNPNPTVLYYNVTAPGSTNAGLLAHLNDTNGGPTGQQIVANGMVPNWDFGSVQAGYWSVAHALALGFDGNTASSIGIRLYNTLDNLNDNWFQDFPAWDVRVKVLGQWADPTQFTQSDFVFWQQMPYGQNTTPLNLDQQLQFYVPTGNDGSSNPVNLLVESAVVSNRWFYNAFIYVAIKPSTVAVAGEHLNWNYRITYLYPQG